MAQVTLLKTHIHKTGGAEKAARSLALGFVKAGCEVTLLTSGDKTNLALPGVSIETICPKNPISLFHLSTFNKNANAWLKKSASHIVFGLERTTNQTHYRAGNGVHAEYLEKRKQRDSVFKRLSFSLNPLHRTILNFEKRAFENPHLKVLFTNSHMVKQEVLKHYKVPEEKICVVHNGVEFNEMEEDFRNWEQLRASTFERFGLKKEAFQLLFIGNGYRRKGLKELLDALCLLQSEDFELSVIGKDKEKSFFEHLTKQLGLHSKVHFFGPQQEMRPFFIAADALVLPSLYDPFANVTVEALAMGLFVLTSAGNGGKEVLTPKSGLVLENPGDRSCFHEALKTLFSKRKTRQSADPIRASVAHLAYPLKIHEMVEKTLAS